MESVTIFFATTELPATVPVHLIEQSYVRGQFYLDVPQRLGCIERAADVVSSNDRLHAKEIAGRRMLEQYFVVVLTRAGGQWSGHSRDFPHIQIKGRSAESTYVETASAVRREIHRLRASGQPLPAFRSYAEVRIDDAFASERGIQWPRAIVRLAALPKELATAGNPPPASAPAEVKPLTRAS